MERNNIVCKISDAVKAYYAGSPIMSDEEYEELVAKSGLGWKDVENIKQDSIVVIDKVKHLWPMTSLPKMHNLNEIKKKSGRRIWQLKFDGSSIEVHYNSNGKFDYACTRGDYTYGDNRTALARVLIGAGKMKESESFANKSVRGELLVSNEDWKVISTEFKNQRNASSGIANRNDLQYASFLTFIPYDVIDDKTGKTSAYLGDNKPAFYDSFDKAKEAFDNSDVPVDGLVVKDYKDSSFEEQTYAIAYKFSDEEYETRLIDVTWQVGKTGKLTPVAHFDTVFIDAEVSKASLGSYAIFKSLDLHYNDKILVKKANMVIPQVVKNLGGGSSESVNAPVWWNGKKVENRGAHLFVEKDDTWKDVLYSQVNSLAGKGISNKFVDACIEEYGVTTLIDLVNTVNADDFKINGVGQVMSSKAKKCLSKIGECTMTAFLSSLSIDSLGWKSMEKIVDKVKDEASQMNLLPEDYIMQLQSPYEFAYAISGLGDASARHFAEKYAFIKDQLDDFEKVFGHMPRFDSDKSVQTGPEVVVTGKFNDGMKRGIVEEELRKNNFNVSSKVTKSTSFLIAGNGGGSKRSAAKSLGVKIIETNGDLNIALNALKDEESNES